MSSFSVIETANASMIEREPLNNNQRISSKLFPITIEGSITHFSVFFCFCIFPALQLRIFCLFIFFFHVFVFFACFFFFFSPPSDLPWPLDHCDNLRLAHFQVGRPVCLLARTKKKKHNTQHEEHERKTKKKRKLLKWRIPCRKGQFPQVLYRANPFT